MASSDIIQILFILAFLLQFIAAIGAIRLVRATTLRRPWVYLASALAILAVLDGVLLFQSISGELLPSFDKTIAVVTLVVSALLAGAMYWTRPHVLALTEAEEAASTERDRFQAMFDGLPGLMVFKDKGSNYLAANQPYAEFLGKQVENLVGKTDHDFFPRSQANLFRQDEEQTLQTGRSRSQEEEVNGVAGRRWLRITRSPVQDEDGKTEGVLVTAYDITEQKQLEASLRKQSSKLNVLQEATLPLFSQREKTIFLQKVLTEAGKLSGAEHGYIGLIDPEVRKLEVMAGKGALKRLEGVQISPGEDLAGNVWETGQASVVKDYSKWPERSEEFVEAHLSSAIGLPLMAGSRVTGAVILAHADGGPAFSSHEITLLKRFARIVSTALQSLQMTEIQAQHLDTSMQTIDTWKQRAQHAHFAATIATQFINLPPEKINQRINQALQTLGRFADVDRCFLVLFSPDGLETEAVYEWCAEGIESRTDTLTEVLFSRFPWWLGKLTRFETIPISQVSELPPEASAIAQFLQLQGIQSYVAAPLISGRTVSGYLGLDLIRVAKEWHQDILDLLKTTSDIFINGLERKRTDEVLEQKSELVNTWIATLEERNRETTLIAEMGDLLQACRTADEAYPIIGRYSQRLFSNCSGAIYVFRSTDDPAEQNAVWGINPPGPAESELSMNECWALRRGRVHKVTDPDAGPNCHHLRDPLPESYLCVPMIAQGEALGLLHLRSDPADRAPQASIDKLHQLALAVAEHIALALSNLTLKDQLRSQAIRDPLTGLFNRRYMEETLDREIRRASRHQTTIGFIMFDVDGLKPVNDTYGHDAGDALLKTLGDLMRKKFRGEDVACRYGGDEFALILPEASLADTWQRADELREAFKNIDLAYEGNQIEARTLSMGVVAFPDHGKNADRLVQTGDAAAYVAKNEGGDRVMIGRASEE